MPAEEKLKIETKLTAARAALLDSVGQFDERAWEWQPGDGRWSARLTLAHVGAAQWSHLTAAGRIAAGQPIHIPGFDLDTWNTAAVAERVDWPVSQVLADLEAAQQATLALLARLDEEELGRSGDHPALGRVSVGQVLRIMALHDNMHRRDILNLRREMEQAG